MIKIIRFSVRALCTLFSEFCPKQYAPCPLTFAIFPSADPPDQEAWCTCQPIHPLSGAILPWACRSKVQVRFHPDRSGKQLQKPHDRMHRTGFHYRSAAAEYLQDLSGQDRGWLHGKGQPYLLAPEGHLCCTTHSDRCDGGILPPIQMLHLHHKL